MAWTGGKLFSKDNQPTKETIKRRTSVDKIIRDMMYDEFGYMDFNNVLLLDENGNPTGQRVNCRVMVGNAQTLITAMMNRAKSDQKAAEYLMNRVGGKPKIVVEQKTDWDDTLEGLEAMKRKMDDFLKMNELDEGGFISDRESKARLSSGEDQTDKGA